MQAFGTWYTVNKKEDDEHGTHFVIWKMLHYVLKNHESLFIRIKLPSYVSVLHSSKPNQIQSNKC